MPEAKKLDDIMTERGARLESWKWEQTLQCDDEDVIKVLSWPFS
jgi:hypothetical protein